MNIIIKNTFDGQIEQYKHLLIQTPRKCNLSIFNLPIRNSPNVNINRLQELFSYKQTIRKQT